MKSDTSAARLHAALSKHADAVRSIPGISGLRAWKAAFGVSKADVMRELALAVGVLGQVHRDTDALAMLGDGAARNLVEIHGTDWARPMLSALEDSDTGARRTAVPADTGSLVALDTVASLLATVSRDGTLLAPKDFRSLQEHVTHLCEALLLDGSVPHELKFLIFLRLQAVRESLDHVNLLGIDAVRQSCDTLAGAISRDFRAPNWRSKFRSFLNDAYALLGAAADVTQIGQGVGPTFGIVENLGSQ